MTHPFRDYIDALLAQGEYAQAAALVRIDGWQPYKFADMANQLNENWAELARRLGERFMPTLENFMVAVAEIDL